MPQATPDKEYEEKFLVRQDLLPPELLLSLSDIEQGFLSIDPVVRVRKQDGVYVVEFKGDNDDEILIGKPAPEQGRKLLKHCADVAGIVKKGRGLIEAGFDQLVWELDVFRGENAPLVVVEIEKPTKTYSLKKHKALWPEWIGKNVTKDKRFKNKYLAVRPFSTWPKAEQKKILRFMGI
jgi:CYTH domain-containing protein